MSERRAAPVSAITLSASASALASSGDRGERLGMQAAPSMPGHGKPDNFTNLAAIREATRVHAARISQFSDNVTTLRAQFTAMQKELRQSVLIDHETQLPNRRRFDEALDGAIARARRAAGRSRC